MPPCLPACLPACLPVSLPVCRIARLPVLTHLCFFQGRHGRRGLGEEESDVDIEGFEEEDDGKPKTPAPVQNVFFPHRYPQMCV